MVKKSIVILCVLLAPSALGGEIYKWVDQNGKVHFSDKKPDSAKVEQVDIHINTYKSVTQETSQRDIGNTVVMYSTTWCMYCKKARQYFRKHRIAFVDYDIEKNSRARRDYDALGATGVPVILVGRERMNGFSEATFDRIYRQALATSAQQK